jgi:AbiTii
MNLVNELQISAERDEVLTVLRKTRRLASKLDRRDISDWLQAEQNGYAPEQVVPDYRLIGTSICYNTNGYVPAGWGYLKNGIEELPGMGVYRTSLREPISSVLSMIEASGRGRGIFLSVGVGSDLDRSIRSNVKIYPQYADQFTFVLRPNTMQVKAIPEQIKDRVLDWACELEAAGVTGDGMSFSDKEKQTAHSITFNIHNSTVGQLNNQGTNTRLDNG